MLECFAWVGITLLGPDGIAALRDGLLHPSATDVVVTTTRDRTEKCSTFDGDLYCIAEATDTAPTTASNRRERCATYRGALYCIVEDA